VEPSKSMQTFQTIGEKHLKEREEQVKAKQAQIAQRLFRIRKEMFKLGKELEAAQQQSPGDTTATSEITEQSLPVKVPTTPQDQLKQLEELKGRLLGLYKTKGFQVLSNHLRHLQLVKQEDQNSLAIDELNVILTKLQTKQESNEGSKEVTLVIDRSKRDVGMLIRLYQLQKRMNVIQKFIGDWKSVSTRLTLKDIVPEISDDDGPGRVRVEEAGPAGPVQAPLHAAAHQTAQ